MTDYRSKTGERAGSGRSSNMKNVLLGVLIGLAVVFIVFAGRYAYGRSKDPNYRMADLFGVSRSAEDVRSTLPAVPTLPALSEERIAQLLSSTAEEASEPAEESSLPEVTELPSGSVPETGELTEPDTEETEAETPEETPAPTPEETPAPTPEETPAPTPEATEPPTTAEPATEAVISDPSDIRYHLNRCGMKESDLGSCRQLIAVESSGTDCVLYFFEKNAGGWASSKKLKTSPGIVGRNGVTTHKVAMDGCTPAGFYGLGPCYGEYASVQTKMEYHQITKHDFWVGDSDTEYYNKLVWLEDTSHIPWKSYEWLIYYMPHYRYLAVIRYNMDPVIPYAGAGIFLHCDGGDKTTAGCVGTSEAMMKAIFAWMDPACDPHILIY